MYLHYSTFADYWFPALFTLGLWCLATGRYPPFPLPSTHPPHPVVLAQIKAVQRWTPYRFLMVPQLKVGVKF